jgi:hypothetical protein
MAAIQQYGVPAADVVATPTRSGQLSATDKRKLDALYQTFPAVRAYHSVNQSIANATPTTLAFDSERFDTSAFHSLTVNSGRLTVPTGLGGLYLAGVAAEWAANAVGERYVAIMVNAATYIARQRWSPGVASSQDNGQPVALYRLAAGDFLTVEVYQASGAALNIAAAPALGTEFWAVRLGD